MDAKTLEKKIEKMVRVIDEEGDPKNMSKTEWKEFLEGIISDLEVRLEVVTQELAEDD